MRSGNKAPKNQFAADLKTGDKVDTVFMVKKKEVRTGRNGQSYLALELVDKTGVIPGRIWERVDRFNSIFDEDDFVLIKGKTAAYRGRTEIQILALVRADDVTVEFSDYLPNARRDKQELIGFLEYFLHEIYQSDLKKLTASFLSDKPFMAKFSEAPGAKNWHHAYLGGLLEHTVAVATICEHVGQLYPEVDHDLLLTAAILHDIGKVDEMEYSRKIDYSDEGRFLGHLIIGEKMLLERIAAIKNFPKQLSLRLRHAILSHHGQLEWGSPKRPSTLEALILHHADNLDAKISGYRDIIFKHSQSGPKWTDVKNLFKRPLNIPMSAEDEGARATEEDI